MTGRIDDRARRASAAVRAQTADLQPDHGLDAVVRRARRPRPGAVLAVLVVLALAVPGIGWLRQGDDPLIELESPTETPSPTASPEDTQPSPTPTPDPTPTPRPTATDDVEEPREATPAPTGPEPAGSFGTREVSAGNFPFGGGEYALLTDVRVAGQEGFDRVVLELDGPDMPSYRVAYTEPPIIQDGSGDAMHVDGTAFIELQLTPASGFDSVGTEWEPTYHGPQRVRGDTAVVTEVVRTGDFEAHLTWVIGLRTERPFAVTTLQDPWRLVIDIQTD
jgi:hypothetical protein